MNQIESEVDIYLKVLLKSSSQSVDRVHLDISQIALSNDYLT